MRTYTFNWTEINPPNNSAWEQWNNGGNGKEKHSVSIELYRLDKIALSSLTFIEYIPLLFFHPFWKI